MTRRMKDRFQEYGFVFAGGLAGITFAQTIIIGGSGNPLNYLIMPLSIMIGYALGRKIRENIGKKASDERDFRNYREGMSWGFITFTVMTAVEAASHLSLTTADILMWSVGIAIASTLYIEIRQSGVRGLIR